MDEREYGTLFKVEDAHWWYRALHKNILQSLKESFPNKSQIEILDAGCGTGLLLQKMQKESQATGIDFSEHAVKFCSQRGLSRIARASVLSLPFIREAFHVVTSVDVLYHKNVSNDQEALQEFYRVLKPEGVLILNLPAFEFLRSSHDRAIHTERRYTKDQVRKMLESNGFRIQDLYYRNSLLFPLVALIRVLRRGKAKNHIASDVILPTKGINEALTRIMFADDWLAKRIPFPAGVSLFCVARKRINR